MNAQLTPEPSCIATLFTGGSAHHCHVERLHAGTVDQPHESASGHQWTSAGRIIARPNDPDEEFRQYLLRTDRGKDFRDHLLDMQRDLTTLGKAMTVWGPALALDADEDIKRARVVLAAIEQVVTDLNAAKAGIEAYITARGEVDGA